MVGNKYTTEAYITTIVSTCQWMNIFIFSTRNSKRLDFTLHKISHLCLDVLGILIWAKPKQPKGDVFSSSASPWGQAALGFTIFKINYPIFKQSSSEAKPNYLITLGNFQNSMHRSSYIYFQKILFPSNLVATVQLHTTWVLVLYLLKYVHFKCIWK